MSVQRLRTRTASSTAGFTLIELAVAAVIVVLVIGAMVRWASDVGTIMQSILDGPQHDSVLLATAQLGEDISALEHCSAHATDARVVQIAADELTLLATHEGEPVTVVWRFAEVGGQLQLQRATAAVGDDCVPQYPTSFGVYLADAGADSSFAAVTDGIVDTGGTDGVCGNEWEARCQPQMVQLTMVVDGDPAVRTVQLPTG